MGGYFRVRIGSRTTAATLGRLDQHSPELREQLEAFAVRAQARRFQARVHDPMRRWKLSPMDLESRARWFAYSRAKDEMFRYTDIKVAPWYVVEADDKRRARLNCVRHFLGTVPYEDLTPQPVELPPPQDPDPNYVRPPRATMRLVPQAV